MFMSPIQIDHSCGVVASLAYVTFLAWRPFKTTDARSIPSVESGLAGRVFAIDYCGGEPHAGGGSVRAHLRLLRALIEHLASADPSGSIAAARVQYRCPVIRSIDCRQRLTNSPPTLRFDWRCKAVASNPRRPSHQVRGVQGTGKYRRSFLDLPPNALIDAGRAFEWLLGDDLPAFYALD